MPLSSPSILSSRGVSRILMRGYSPSLKFVKHFLLCASVPSMRRLCQASAVADTKKNPRRRQASIRTHSGPYHVVRCSLRSVGGAASSSTNSLMSLVGRFETPIAVTRDGTSRLFLFGIQHSWAHPPYSNLIVDPVLFHAIPLCCAFLGRCHAHMQGLIGLP